MEQPRALPRPRQHLGQTPSSGPPPGRAGSRLYQRNHEFRLGHARRQEQRDHDRGHGLRRQAFDHAVSVLIRDLEARGLQDKVLLVCCGKWVAVHASTRRVGATTGPDPPPPALRRRAQDGSRHRYLRQARGATRGHAGPSSRPLCHHHGPPAQPRRSSLHGGNTGRGFPGAAFRKAHSRPDLRPLNLRAGSFARRRPSIPTRAPRPPSRENRRTPPPFGRGRPASAPSPGQRSGAGRESAGRSGRLGRPYGKREDRAGPSGRRRERRGMNRAGWPPFRPNPASRVKLRSFHGWSGERRPSGPSHGPACRRGSRQGGRSAA